MRSYVFVCVQLLSVAIIFLTHPIPESYLAICVDILAAALAMWAIGTMRIGNISVLPDLKQGMRLVTTGPYRWIRHPMYSAVLLITLAQTLDQFTLPRGCVWIVLLIDLIMKLRYEEHLLVESFPEYRKYAAHTSRLLPWMY